MPVTPEEHLPETILAFDFGLRRIGVAVGQSVTGSASPAGIIANGASGPDWQRIGQLIDEWRPARLVVGMPAAADGSPTAMAANVEIFIDALGRFGLPVNTVDERYSSIEAEQRLIRERQLGLRGRIGREAIDAAAAVLIAERWLQHGANHPA